MPKPLSTAVFYCTTRLLYPFPRLFARAEEQAEEYGHGYDRELHYLAVHGLCHLLGYDHMTDEDKPEMRAKEERVLEKMNLKRDS